MVKSTKLPKKKRQAGIRTLTVKLDTVFSKYIRLSNADKNGTVICFTCGGVHTVNDTDNGHYISRSTRSTRWDEQNCHPQCKSCNRFRDGMKDVYALKLQEKYGKDILEELNQRKNQVFKASPDWLLSKIEYYKQKVKEME